MPIFPDSERDRIKAEVLTRDHFRQMSMRDRMDLLPPVCPIHKTFLVPVGDGRACVRCCHDQLAKEISFND